MRGTINKHELVLDVITRDDLAADFDAAAREIVTLLDTVNLQRTDVVSRAVHNAAVNIAVLAGLKAEAQAADLTEELEQCKIELQTAYDRIWDLEKQLET